LKLLFFVTSSLTTPSISTPLVAPFFIAHVAPSVALIVPSFVVPFDLPFDVTPLLATYAHLSLSGSNLHVDSPTSSEKVIN